MGVRAVWSRDGGSSGGSGEPETGEGVAGDDGDDDESTAAAAEREGLGLGLLLFSFRRLRGGETSASSSAGLTVSLFAFFRCFFFRA